MPNEVRNSKFLVLENYKKIFDIGSKLMRSVISAFSGISVGLQHSVVIYCNSVEFADPCRSSQRIFPSSAVQNTAP